MRKNVQQYLAPQAHSVPSFFLCSNLLAPIGIIIEFYIDKQYKKNQNSHVFSIIVIQFYIDTVAISWIKGFVRCTLG